MREAAQHEFHHLVDHFGVGQLAAVQAHGLFGQGLQIQRQVFLDDDAQHAQCGAAQRERVFIAFRMLPDAEDAGEVSILSAIAGEQATSDCGSASPA